MIHNGIRTFLSEIAPVREKNFTITKQEKNKNKHTCISKKRKVKTKNKDQTQQRTKPTKKPPNNRKQGLCTVKICSESTGRRKGGREKRINLRILGAYIHTNSFIHLFSHKLPFTFGKRVNSLTVLEMKKHLLNHKSL